MENETTQLDKQLSLFTDGFLTLRCSEGIVPNVALYELQIWLRASKDQNIPDTETLKIAAQLIWASK